MFELPHLHNSVLVLIICCVSQAMAGTVDRADLASADEIVRVRALWGVAQAGKASGCTEADVLPLLTKTWEGRRLSKWALHALVKLGAPASKHFDTYIAAATWTEKRPSEVDARKKSEPEWRAKLEGPTLPEELNAALPTVWGTAVDAVFAGYVEDKVLDKYRNYILDMKAPRELVAPRLAAIFSDTKKPLSQRRSAGYTLQMLRRCEGVTDAAIAVMSDPDENLRQQAVSVLASLAMDVDSYGDIIWVYKHPDRDKALAAFFKTMKTDPSPRVRRSATQALRSMGTDATPAWPQIIETIKTEKGVRASLLYVLAALQADVGIPVFIEYLNDPDPEVQGSALDSLELTARQIKAQHKALKIDHALPAIEKVLKSTKDPKVKTKAEEAMKSIKDI